MGTIRTDSGRGFCGEIHARIASFDQTDELGASAKLTHNGDGRTLRYGAGNQCTVRSFRRFAQARTSALGLNGLARCRL